MKTRLATLVLLSLAIARGTSQLVTYDFEGDVNTPANSAAGIDPGNFELNSGDMGFAAGSVGRAISGADWRGDPGTRFWQFSLVAGAGIHLDLASFSFDYRSTSTGPTDWSLTINGTTAGGGTLLNDSTFHFESVPLSSFAGLTSAEVNLVGFGGSGASGTWRIDNVNLDGLTVAAVPEPSTWVLIVGGGLVLGARLRGRT